MLVTIDKFSMWIEARPLVKIGSKHTVNFIQGIIFHFGVPNSIFTDNCTQFTREKFLDFYDDNNIWVDLARVTHPRTNKQVECANDLILQGQKPVSSHRKARTSTPGSTPELGSGPLRSPRYSGACGQCPTGRLTSHHFLWCTVWRSCCPPNCSMGPLGSKPTNWPRSNRHGRMLLTARGIEGHHRRKVSQVPTNNLTIPCLDDVPSYLPSRRLSLTLSADEEK
jgi:hypothetical protein